MQVVAVTGASAGVGRSVATRFAKEGYRVGLIARSDAALEELKAEIEKAGGHALALPCDVSDSAALESAADRIEAAFGPIDVWVNSAMVTVFSRVIDTSPAEYRRVSDVTYHGCVFGTLAALKRMQPRNRGHIIQIGSALSSRAIPLQSAYCAAKHAIRGFSDALRAELLHEGSTIELSVVQLPALNTPQFTWARNHTQRKPQPLPPIHHPSLAAEAVLWTVNNPQREVWVGWPTWKAMIGQRFLPGFLDHYVARTAWQGQFTGAPVEPDSPDNLFETVDGLHSEQGPFTDRVITQKPMFWQVRNHNFWINGAAFTLLVAVFLLGLILG